VINATFQTPDVTVFCRFDELGLEITGQRVECDRTVLECRAADLDDWCANWQHTRLGDKHVTVIIDLTPVRDGPAPPGCWTWLKSAPNTRSSNG